MGRPDLYKLLNEGLSLWHRGHPFSAHESWETAWHQTSGPEKLFSQALVLLAATRTKVERGEPVGTLLNLRKALEKLERVPSPSVFGINTKALRESVKTRVETSTPEVPPADETLKALLPETVSERGIVYLHGFASGPSSSKSRQFHEELKGQGWAFRAPDLNQPSFKTLTITRAIAHAQSYTFDYTLMVGSSMGAYVSALLANQESKIKAMVLMAPAFGLGRLLSEQHGPMAIDTWKREGHVLVDHYAYGGKHPINYTFLDDALTHPEQPNLDRPTYILAGQNDNVVPVKQIHSALDRSGPHVKYDIVDDDHSLLNSVQYAISAAIRLANSHLK